MYGLLMKTYELTVNLGIYSAWRKAAVSEDCCRIVNTTTLIYTALRRRRRIKKNMEGSG